MPRTLERAQRERQRAPRQRHREQHDRRQRRQQDSEATLGGAHPTEAKPIDDHFEVRVPFARSISPYTKTNWEGTGIEPDVKVAADQALDVALKLAAEEIGKKR